MMKNTRLYYIAFLIIPLMLLSCNSKEGMRKVIEQHNRFLMGLEIGTGIFMELGRFNFQQELTFTKMFSFYNERNYSEFSVNFNTGIVYKF